MSISDPVNWMLSEAIDSLARAERLRQQFFSLQATAGRATSWEPPIDVLETDREISHSSPCPASIPTRSKPSSTTARLSSADTGRCRQSCATPASTGSNCRKAASSAASRCLPGVTRSAVLR